MSTNPAKRQLFVIGGAEDKLGDREILRAFVEASGGRDARILVIPVASSIEREVADTYRKVFRDLGVDEVSTVIPDNRRAADQDEVVDEVHRATGIFMTGGNQAKLTTIVAGTRMGQALALAHEQGTPIGGTSAGASAMASHMVYMGTKGDVPKNRMATTSAGLGLLPDTIIDQHFQNRNRTGRLMTLVAQSPSHLGIGVDENTCLHVVDHGDGDVTGEVLGAGVVMFVDGRHLETNAWEAERHQPILLSGAVLHLLPAGHRFDVTRRRLVDTDHPDHLVTDAAEDWAEEHLEPRQVQRVDTDSADDRLLRQREKRAQKRKRVSLADD